MQPSDSSNCVIIYFIWLAFIQQGYIAILKKAFSRLIVLSTAMVGLIVSQAEYWNFCHHFGIILFIILSSGIRFKYIGFSSATFAVGIILIAIPFLVTEKRIARITETYKIHFCISRCFRLSFNIILL